MKAIQIISQDLFDKVRSRFTNLEMGDEQGAVTIDPAEARFFDFDLVIEGNELGRVSISINDPGSLKIYYSQGITEDYDVTVKKEWFDFLKEMRFFAMRRLLRFDTRDISKSNLEKKDFQHLATTQGSKEENMITMNESRWKKNTKKTSRAVQGKTEVIVRHKHSMEEMHPALRSMPNKIESIFIQNSLGERYKYPFEHLDGAFAMAQHVEHGGVPHDAMGKAIIEMSSQIAQLQEFNRHVKRSTLHDDAMGISERAMHKMQELKMTMKSLGKRRNYEAWAESFQENAPLQELDPVTMEEYKSKFTQSSFNENLMTLFPLIHSIMQEKNTIDLEEYVNEEIGYNEITPKSASFILRKIEQDVPMSEIVQDFPELEHMMDEIAGLHGLHRDDDFEEIENILMNELEDLAAQEDDFGDESRDDFAQFENWAEAVTEGEQRPLTDEEIADLKKELDRLAAEGGLQLGPNGETAWETFSAFGLEDTDLENMLKDKADTDSSINPLDVLADWAAENYPELLPPLGLTQQTQPEVQPQPEMQPPQQPVAEGKGKKSYMHDIAETVKRFYNEDNPDVGPFRTPEGICLEVEKNIEEKYGPAMAKRASMIAEKLIEKLTRDWEMKHQKSTQELAPSSTEIDQGDGFARIQELINMAKKVTGNKRVKETDSPSIGGVSQTTGTGGEVTQNYRMGPMSGSQTTDQAGNLVKTTMNAKVGFGSDQTNIGAEKDFKSGITTKTASGAQADNILGTQAVGQRMGADTQKLDQFMKNMNEMDEIRRLAGLAK